MSSIEAKLRRQGIICGICFEFARVDPFARRSGELTMILPRWSNEPKRYGALH